jgi:GH35 family endo-1,4-beta-xylanase
MNANMLSAMSDAYRQLWNDNVQQAIDRNIEQYRKADARVELNLAAGTEVKVEQLSHEFIFGAHIFNFNQLGTTERNDRYKELFGAFFNSATIAFYWKKFELEDGKPRFRGEYRDTEEYWNSVADPKAEPHWRRPATDPVVEFCERKGVRLHGHPLVWGNNKWHYPEWLIDGLPAFYTSRRAVDKDSGYFPGMFDAYTAEQLEKMFPEFADEINARTARRIFEIANRYRGRIHSWDVVNESATDFEQNRMVPGSALCKSVYGLMPGDYTYRSFKIADGVFPKSVLLNINDYNLRPCYPDQVRDLLERGCKVDIMGAQMHLFNPQACLDIADGKSNAQSPANVRETMERLSRAGLPIHLSEITITAPNNDERGQAIQAVMARNLYRLWFSVEKMMGITWWNVVDDCGAPGEPSVSGLFSRDMEPKPAYHALNRLIHTEWKTNAEVAAGRDGRVEFRGFRGAYRLSWRGADGSAQTHHFNLA